MASAAEVTGFFSRPIVWVGLVVTVIVAIAGWFLTVRARQEGRTDRADVRQDGKTERVGIRQDNKTQRKCVNACKNRFLIFSWKGKRYNDCVKSCGDA